MKSEQIRNLALSGVLAALCTVATIVIQIPSPLGGYIHLGDAVVLLCGFLLGPVWGAAAAGIGSMAADLITGDMLYAPGTLVIKALVALCAALVGRTLLQKHPASKLPFLIAALLGEAVMVVGYFLYSALLMGKGFAAVEGVTSNLVQAVAGIVISEVVLIALSRTSFFKTRFTAQSN